MHPANVRRFAVATGAALSILAGGSAAVSGTGSTLSTTPIPKIDVLEWDIPENADARPGAVMVDLMGDGNRLWFVTRTGERVYRLDLRGGKKVNQGQWFSWELDPMGIGNGVRKVRSSGDKRYVFVDSTFTLQRVDTVNCATKTLSPLSVTCTRTMWSYTIPDDPVILNPDRGSDVAIDDYNNDVYTAIAASDADGADGSFIQRLDPDAKPFTNNVTRWYVGHNVGFCPFSNEPQCLSGITVDRRNRDLVYYSEPGNVVFDPTTGGLQVLDAGAISELNTRYNTVRRWRMQDLAVATSDGTISQPRQLQFDNDGTLWAVTGSGHLVSLDPRKNRMSKHMMPTTDATKSPFAVGPDGGLIGYTDPAFTDPRVGMLMPARRFVLVKPVPQNPVYKSFQVQGADTPADRTTGSATPIRKFASGQIARTEDGTFSEVFTAPTVASTPLGVTPDQSASSGTFFFAIGDLENGTLKKIARVRLPRKDFHGRVERDDDDNDDDGKRNDVDDDVDDDGIKNAMDSDSDNDGIPDISDDDDDNDGIEDSFDTKDKKESKQTSQQDLAPGETGEDPFTLNANTLLCVMSAISTDPLANVKIEVVDAAGSVVASSLNTPGTATLTFIPPAAGGNYTLRVKNQSLTGGSISTKILTRELWPIGL